MTDESTTKTDSSRSSGAGPSTPTPSKQPFGDKPDKTTQRTEPAEVEDGEVDDAGEGHKGPLVDATSGSTAPRAQSSGNDACSTR